MKLRRCWWSRRDAVLYEAWCDYFEMCSPIAGSWPRTATLNVAPHCIRAQTQSPAGSRGLLVQGIWKMVTGLIDAGEDVPVGAAREVKVCTLRYECAIMSRTA